ncbi:MAG: hypothetical protein NW701_17120 [Nitrospira sp.]
MSPDQRPADRTMSGTQPAEITGESHIHLYEPSGIRERSGHIPTWLTLVIFALIVWGLYYGIRYWNSY